MTRLPIPPLDPHSGLLPPGNPYKATLDEVEAVFGGPGHRRKELTRDLREVCGLRRAASVGAIYVDGSFTTTKIRPADVDVIFVITDETEFENITNSRRRAYYRDRYRIDLMPSPARQPPRRLGERSLDIIDWFQESRDGTPKGIIELVEDR